MAPTPKDNPAILKEWQKKEKQLTRSMSKKKAHKSIGEEYDCALGTVSYWLSGKYSKNPKSILGLSSRQYNTLYKKVSRNLPDYLYNIYGDINKTYSLNTVSKKLFKTTKIRFTPETIESLVEKIGERKGCCPIRHCGGTSGAFGLSQRYYNRFKPKVT